MKVNGAPILTAYQVDPVELKPLSKYELDRTYSSKVMGKILKSQIKNPLSYLNIAIKYRSQIVFYKWDRETRNATLRLYPQRQNTHSKTRTSAVTAHAATRACKNFITPKKCFDFKRSKNLNRWPVEVRAVCIGLVAPKTYQYK